MEVQCTWIEKLQFSSRVRDHEVTMDAKRPLGSDAGGSPKELLLASICGCTGMDVASLLRKGKQEPTLFVIEASAEQTTDKHPHIFREVLLTYKVEGPVDAAILNDAVTRSMTQYCGVSAMVSKACPIRYSVVLNGEVTGEGEAKFA